MNLTFVITNNLHHQLMMVPVAAALAAQHRLHLLSFAELRGMDTPVDDWAALGATICRVPPLNIRPRRPEAESLLGLGGAALGSRDRLRAMVWHGLLRHCIRLREPNLVVLPNDAAFPGDHLVRRLNRARIPFVLVQEGIRFPLPGQGKSAYGTAGAAAIACWGTGDVEYFASLGVPRERLHALGNPRYDAILKKNWFAEGERLRAQGQLPDRYVLFASNPIDDQGFCSTHEKYAAFSGFARQAVPVLRQRGLRLALKLHGRESAEGYRSALGELAQQVILLPDGEVHPVLAAAEAVVVWASTVGLEALLHGRPLGVLETPGHGHVFDYVERQAAVPLTTERGLNSDLLRLLSPDPEREHRTRRYLDWRMTRRADSTTAVAALIQTELARVAT